MDHTQNGYGGGVRRIERLLEYHQRAADALRTTLDLLRARQGTARAERQSTVLADAINLDAARQARTRGRPRGRPKTKIDDRVERRTLTAKFLDGFSSEEPSLGDESLRKELGSRAPIGSLLRHGYLRRRGPGYVRTAKPFSIGG